MVRNVLARPLAAAVMVAALAIPSVAGAAAPAPVLHNDNATAKAGDWYHGALPPNVDYSKPVILFVQGLHSDYTTWYNSNGYYDAAYNMGYRTAFVQLKDADGGGGSPWTNGPMLASVIKKVAAYYGVSKLNIIAHSKGGIDTQSALIHYGAYPYVNVVHQLSTPNKGSELADMSYGSWTWWIGAIMGQQDDAVYSLQTSWMASFRSQTDSRTEKNYARTYTSAGWGDEGIGTAYWYAHAVLPGEDDGAVAEYSALGLPWGIKSFTADISHTEMRHASQTWSKVYPKLTTYSYYSAPQVQADAVEADAVIEAPQESSNMILRGGQVKGQAQDTFVVEDGLDSITLDVMTAHEDSNVVLVAPWGKRITAEKKGKSGETTDIFGKASHNYFQIEKPEKGTWTIEVEGNDDAYFMYANVQDSDAKGKAKVKANKKVFKKGEVADLSIEFDKVKMVADNVKKAKVTKAKAKTNKGQEIALAAKGNTLTTSFEVPSESGVYNLSFDVTGINENGDEFTRSVNYNFAVADENGKVE
ncbi:esterase/lipase family protein [Brevibacillus dissolubilis]|uniref:esterase/lipase family protein n=1 Tax=Brevibacillus dissolubilis TaxID=1844116 RepID=UPI001116E67E|nr:alpha/beta hydrolase [Brevibacillus dissolubilis]